MILLNTLYKILLEKRTKTLCEYSYLNIENIHGTLSLCEILNPFFILVWEKAIQYAIKAFFHYDKLNNLQIVCLPRGRFFISMVS